MMTESEQTTDSKTVPPGLKPVDLGSFRGTARAVSLQNTSMSGIAVEVCARGWMR